MKISQSNKGFSLLELMIAMVLGLFIIAGVMQMFLGANRSYLLAEGISRTQESGRSSLHFLAQSIRMAGYGSLGPISNMIINDCADELSDVCSKNSNSGSDRLAVQLEAPMNNYLDCAGMAHAESTLFANVFWQNGSDLVCRSWNSDPDVSSWFAPSQVLVSGISSFQVLYGTGTQYVGDVPADAASIVSIKIAVLTDSGDANVVEKKSRDYFVLDADPLSFDDTTLRRIYSTTVSTLNSPALMN